MKVCIACGQRKPLAAFQRDSSKADGLYALCRPCSSAKAAAWKAANPGRAAETLRVWRQRNKDRVRDQRDRWSANRPGHKAAVSRARRQQARRRVPWRDMGAMRRYYRLAKGLRAVGLDVHVGHWVPLRSRVVCGLHVQTNLCLELAADNMRKGSRVVPQCDPPAISRALALKFCVPAAGST